MRNNDSVTGEGITDTVSCTMCHNDATKRNHVCYFPGCYVVLTKHNSCAVCNNIEERETRGKQICKIFSEVKTVTLSLSGHVYKK